LFFPLTSLANQNTVERSSVAGGFAGGKESWLYIPMGQAQHDTITYNMKPHRNLL
jgi:hypothetical protein